MKDRAEFESAVSVYLAEVKRFRRSVFLYHFIVYAWLLLLYVERPLDSSQEKFVFLVIVCPVIFVGIFMLRARKLDSVAEAAGLRCPNCKSWLSRKITGAYVRKTGKCMKCGATIFHRGKTIGEQLTEANLKDDFDAAIHKRDREQMLSLLMRINMKEKSAVWLVDNILANPKTMIL
ncbi:MAG TPA: hypothetical protein VHG89_12540 [Verrucomicrobiae bacterium]|nr:hypothetical protein [Verrucomicrobiae bacterium]